MKKLLSFFLVVTYITSLIPHSLFAVTTDGNALNWTREKAEKLATSALFNNSPIIVDRLYTAGSASNAVDLLFPDRNGPDRMEYDAYITNFTSSGFNWGDNNHVIRLYQMMYALDPYEAKRKLFSLYEDIFSVNANTDLEIAYMDIYDLHKLVYDNMFGNYKSLVKKVLYNNGGKGDYAASKFLDLLNQQNPNRPNENYARELLQLFLMGEYEPYKTKDAGDARSYEESDVLALAKILTGLRSDKVTHAVSYDGNYHYTGASLVFLTGELMGTTPPYYTASGTVDPVAILTPVNGNNGLTDNVIEYIFAKRERQIALFLADRLARFYVSDAPTRPEIDTVADIIQMNGFDMFNSVKALLKHDIMYSDRAMNSIHFKNPLELAIGTLKLIRNNSFTGVTSDPSLVDTNLLRRLGWTPYFPGSIFGRDGFDNSLKWSSTSVQSAWMTASNYYSYRINGTGSIDLFSYLSGSGRKLLTNEIIPVITYQYGSYTGSLMVLSGSIFLGEFPTIGVNLSISKSILSASTTSDTSSGSTSSGSTTPDTSSGVTSSGSTVSDTSSGSTSSGSIILDTGTGSTVSDTSSGSSSTGSPSSDTSSGATSSGSTSFDTSTGSVVLDASTGSTSSGSTIPDTSSGTTSSGSITSDTSSGSTSSGSTTVDTSSGSTTPDSSSGSTSSGSIDSVLVVPQAVQSTGTSVDISTGTVFFPNFRISTNTGTLYISGGTYDASQKMLYINSGWLVDKTGSGTYVNSGMIQFTPESYLYADTVTTDDVVNTYEKVLFSTPRFPSDVRDAMKYFISHDASGSLLPIAVSNTTYFNTYIRGLFSMMLSQPEYVLSTGYDLSTESETNETTFFDGRNEKLFIIELYGGNDYLTSLIPKDEYDYYSSIRTNASGSIAISGTGLVDIGDFYMNAALGYSSGTTGFKDLYDQGYMKFFNRVGAPLHSSDHDQAAKQISSYDATTLSSAEGWIGHLVQNERESSHTISLGAKIPNVFRGGHFVNLGGNVILTNPLDGSGFMRSHMLAMQNLALKRSFPGKTKNLFQDAGRISEIGRLSVSQGGAPGASGNMTSVFNFAKVLMNNNIGRTFYMGGAGGYDTHGNQLNGLNTNLTNVSAAVTKFFNEVKDTQDVTIVIFSEFGRTNRTNGDLGTDHGDGGGIYVLSSNPRFRQMHPQGTYGNMSIMNSKRNSLGIGVDYRSVFGNILNALYGINPVDYFKTNIDLLRDISLEKNNVNLYSVSYQASGLSIARNIEFNISGSNYDPKKAGYTRLVTGTGAIGSGTGNKITTLTEKVTPEGYRYAFSLNPVTQTYFRIDSFSNQYALTSWSGSLTGTENPIILPNTSRTISQAKTSILTMFGATTVPGVLAGTGIIIENTGGTTLSIPGNPNIKLVFQSGTTRVNNLTYISGSTVWRGGFVLAEPVNPETFIPDNAKITLDNSSLSKNYIYSITKLGADLRGVGMDLSQAIGIEFQNLKPGDKYRVLTSEDGINWNDLESAAKEYTVGSSGTLLVNTLHFSYFALMSTNQVVTPMPSCNISANPLTVVNGSSSLLSWSLTNAQTGVLNPGNVSVNTTGNLSVTPPSNATTSYVIGVANTSGTGSCSVSVKAQAAPPPPAPTCTLSSNPNSVLNGSGSTLSWNISGAQTGTIQPGNIPVNNGTGSVGVIPPINATTLYVLSTGNAGGTTTCSTSIVASGSIAPPPPQPPTCTLTSNPGTVSNGSGSTLNWNINGAQTGVIQPGNILVNSAIGSIGIVPPISTTTQYVLSTSNSGGTASCNASVTAVPVTSTGGSLPSCTINANPTSLANGSTTRLTWSLSGAASGLLSPGNISLGVSGTRDVVPPDNAVTPYIISVTNSKGTTTCRISVTTSSISNSGSTVNVGPGGPSASSSYTIIKTKDTSPLSQSTSGKYVFSSESIDSTISTLETKDDISARAISLQFVADIWSKFSTLSRANRQQEARNIINYLISQKDGRGEIAIREINWMIGQIRHLGIGLTSFVTQNQTLSSSNTEEGQTDSMDTSDAGYQYASDSVYTDSNEEDKTKKSGVSYISVENSVNLRTTPIISELNILKTLSRNAKVEILEQTGDWTLIRDEAGTEGFVMTKYLRDEVLADQIRSGTVDASLGEKMVVTASHSLNLRSSPTVYSRIKAILFHNDEVIVLDRVGKWVEVLSGAYHGFVSKYFLGVK